jgi:hypothetical protein
MPYADDDDDLEDSELPEPDTDDGPEDAVDTVPCPFCKTAVYDEAEWCPHCRNYLFYDGTAASAKPWWVVGGVIVCLLVVLYWILH